MSIDPNTIQNLSQSYTGADGDFSAYGDGVTTNEYGVYEVDGAKMQQQGTMAGAAQGAALAQSLPIQNPIIKGALTVGLGAAGALKGSGDADYAYADANREKNLQRGTRSNEVMDNLLAQNLSGANTLPLPKTDATQITNQKEPTQATQTTDQLRSLGLT